MEDERVKVKLETLVGARLEKQDYINLMALVVVGVFESKSHALRVMVHDNIQQYMDRAQDIIALKKALASFDNRYIAVCNDREAASRLISEIDALEVSLHRDTIYRLEQLSLLLKIARAEQ